MDAGVYTDGCSGVLRREHAYDELKRRLLMGDFPLHVRLGEERLASLLGRVPHPGPGGAPPPPRRGPDRAPPRGRLPTHRPRRRRRSTTSTRCALALELQALRRPAEHGTTHDLRRPRAAPRRVAGARRQAARARPRLRHPRRGLPRAVGRGVREPVAGRPAPDRSTSASGWCGCTTSSPPSGCERTVAQHLEIARRGAGRRPAPGRWTASAPPGRVDGGRRAAGGPGPGPHGQRQGAMRA